MKTVALILVLAMVSVADAAVQVYFEATSGATPIQQGAPGMNLILPDPGTYDVDMYL